MKTWQFLTWRLRTLLAKIFPFCPRRRHKTGRVLCLLTGGLGDKLMALPAVRYFRKSFPESEFTLLLIGPVAPFFESEAERVISLKLDDTPGLLREAFRGFDACFVNSIGVFDVRCELAVFLTGAPDLRGPRFSDMSARGTVYNKPYVFGEGHETVINLRGGGGSTALKQIPYPLNLAARTAEDVFPDVILHPGSSSTGLTNRWPTEFYATVARKLAECGLNVAAVGAPAEKPLLDSLASLAGDSLTVLSSLSLKELALLLSRVRLVIANDSGVGHLTAAVGTPLITIMGATRPDRVAPVGQDVTIIGPRCEYGGCYNNPQVPECKMCIDQITPDEVFQAAITKL